MLDETTTTAQDSLSDNNQGPASDGNNGSTSNHPVTFTEDQVAKRINDALVKAGREAKALAAREAKLKDIEAREQALKDKEDEAKRKAEDAEFNSVKDDPAKLSIYELRKKAREEMETAKAEKEALAREKAELEEDRKLAASARRGAIIADAVKDYDGIDATKLTTLCEKLGLTTKEQITAAAETFGNKKTGTPAATTATVTVDSGKTNGGAEDLSKLSPEAKIAWAFANPEKNTKTKK